PRDVARVRRVVIGRIREAFERAADEVLGGMTGDVTQRAIDPQKTTGAIALDADQRHPDRRLVERTAEALLRLVHRGLIALALGDIAQHDRHERLALRAP